MVYILPVIVCRGIFPDIYSHQVVWLVIGVANKRENVFVDHSEVETSGLEGALSAQARQVTVQLYRGMTTRVRFLNLRNMMIGLQISINNL